MDNSGVTLTVTDGGTFSGVIQNGGGNLALTVNGSGKTLTLSGTNTYTGATTVTAGTLLVNGSIASATTVNNGGTLGGIGITAGVTINSGGTLSPGVSGPGTLTVSNLIFSSGAIASLDINSPYGTAGTDYDQVIDSGALTLNGATLTLNGGATAPAGSLSMELFNHTGSGAITGMFSGINEGATVSVGSFQGSLTYKGGDGNDVVLSRRPWGFP